MVRENSGGKEDSIKRNEELYSAAQAGSKDAIFDLVGTISLLIFALFFIFIGTRALVIGGSTILGVGFIVSAVIVAAAACNLIPPFRG
ncbi:hypothetical protein JMJ58_21070 (plasmid) [Haloterrigena salifodinae]|uniref:Uncharacterized protein n=1 Tax=Haloterrigena salifodinae TaxID=2675099 RepID=A0A8T8E7J6_9EURY|nr:hypothetical protein [Haloterrigena salifodinae]QRV17450.1 hypothetical protein JMJ58_21070 [Haloterrigena salifodinae]